MKWNQDNNGKKCIYLKNKSGITIRLYTKKEVIEAIGKGWMQV